MSRTQHSWKKSAPKSSGYRRLLSTRRIPHGTCISGSSRTADVKPSASHLHQPPPMHTTDCLVDITRATVQAIPHRDWVDSLLPARPRP